MRDVWLGPISNRGRPLSDRGHVRILQSLRECRALRTEEAYVFDIIQE